MRNRYWCSPDCKACASGTYCSCGLCEFCDLEYWTTLNSVDMKCHNFCPSCGDQLLPDGRVIQRETVPNKLMAMLREVQDTCPENGLQEFALRCFNWIDDERHANNKPFFQVASQANYYCAEYSNDFLCEPSRITLGELFRLLNAAKQEAKE